MKNQPNKECCNGCKNGQPGGNVSCKAKLMVEEINEVKEKRFLETKNRKL
tara:strand:- start:634 stop:783 length:150 start_codon:yes stop_codon:yes gene_type:complete